MDIRRLVNLTKADQDEVYDRLSSNLCYLYEVNTATLVAVPILLELLRSVAVPGKLVILWIFKNSFYGVERSNRNNSLIEVKVAREIAKGLDLYIELLRHPDWKIRQSVWLLLKHVGWFPDEARSQLNHALQSFILAEKHPTVVFNIRHHLEEPDYLSNLPRRFYPDDD